MLILEFLFENVYGYTSINRMDNGSSLSHEALDDASKFFWHTPIHNPFDMSRLNSDIQYLHDVHESIIVQLIPFLYV